MSGARWFQTCLAVCAFAVCAPLRAQSSAATDSLFRRAQRLVNDGDTVAGRALVDSLVRVAREGTHARAEALFWRATLASDSAAAENDLMTIVVDHALSPRAPDALLRLGQWELGRGDRAGALARFDRLLLDYSSSAAAGDGWYWMARARMASGDPHGACAALDSAKRRLRASDVERRNQVTFAAQPCAALAEARTAVPPPANPPAAAPPPVSGRTPPATPPRATAAAPPKPSEAAARRWSAQVAAYKTQAEAERLVRNLKARGVEARVDRLALFHVRTGSFATRAEAVAMVAQLKRKQINAFVVEAPRREP